MALPKNGSKSKAKIAIQILSSEIKRSVNPHGHTYWGFQWLLTSGQEGHKKVCGT